MMAVYYNEIDTYAAAWLRNLMKEGLIPDGEVDTRSIVDVRSSDLRGFRQAHFFAGVAGWSHALRLAGWADDREIFTGSCPCQPFSQAGKQLGTADERHLWPVFFNLIRECRPAVVMGEQVASKAGRDWFSGVRSDLEGVGYAVGGADLCAAGVGAPHIRQRLYWIALADTDSRDPRTGRGDDGEMRGIPAAERGPEDGAVVSGRGGEGYGHGGMADAKRFRRQGSRPLGKPVHSAQGGNGETDQPVDAGAGRGGNMADASRLAQREPHDDMRAVAREDARARSSGSSERHSAWADAVWLTGADGKARRAKPGICLLADGVPARVGKLRAFGNAIVPPLAAEVIRAFMEVA